MIERFIRHHVSFKEVYPDLLQKLIKGEYIMPVATHVIKVKAEFNENWDEEKLEKLVKTKIGNEIDDFFSPESELFHVGNNVIDIWILIEFCGDLLLIKDISNKWLKDHIKEEGITIKNLEVEKIPVLLLVEDNHFLLTGVR